MRRSVRAADSIRHVCCSACRARRANDIGTFSFLRLFSVGDESNRHSKGSPMILCDDMSRAADSIRNVCCSACRAPRQRLWLVFLFPLLQSAHRYFFCFSNLCLVVSQDPLIYADRSSTLCKAFHTNLILSELQNLVLVKLLPNPYLNCSSLFRISPQQSILYHRICLISRYR